MKKTLFLNLALILITNQIIAQIKSRQLTRDIAIYSCDIVGKGSDTNKAEVGLKYALIDSIGTLKDNNGDITHYIVAFLLYKDADLQSAFNYNLTPEQIYLDTNGDKRATDPSLKKYFIMSKSDYENGTINAGIEKRLSIIGGALTVPLKLRFEDWRINDFSKDITLSSVAGLKIKDRSKLGGYWIPFAGLGISSVSLDSVNTNGELRGSSDRSAISVTSGIMYETDKGLQISLTGGWDHLRKSENLDWCYNGNFWIGFGVGFSLLSEPKKNDVAGDQPESKTKKKK